MSFAVIRPVLLVLTLLLTSGFEAAAQGRPLAQAYGNRGNLVDFGPGHENVGQGQGGDQILGALPNDYL
jgi:hypothetical protein